MTRTLKQLLRPLIPNLSLRIPHVEQSTTLEVRLRQHLGLIARGTRAYESSYVAVLRSLINEGDRVFDVGANIGFYSVLFSCWVGTSGKVLAYEPDPSNVKLLRRNLDLNRCENLVLREMALSSESGESRFSRDIVTGSTGHLGAGATYGETIFGNGRKNFVQVDVTTLDREVELWGPPHLIKLDIEGGEFDVLSGGMQLLKQHRPIVVSELSSWTETPLFGSSKSELAIKLLGDQDYITWDLDSSQRVESANDAWMILGVPREQVSSTRIQEVLGKFQSPA